MQSECTKLIRCRARPPMGVESCRRVVGYKEEKHFAQLTRKGKTWTQQQNENAQWLGNNKSNKGPDMLFH